MTSSFSTGASIRELNSAEGSTIKQHTRRRQSVIIWEVQFSLQIRAMTDGRDGYDAVEHIAHLPWCNGSVALVGNSWLAMSQWFIAAEQPPHLKCIAPLEGAGDIDRETLGRGGVPAEPFHRFISGTMLGEEYPLDALCPLCCPWIC